eukprot:CAMPEP_0197177988 /NCGR_PEP_ID=MMETSP1423-20130617/3401_1 /TAXON_ID=476441 /ORGANISM="Pseudo-nitzschia heimii, Strain UNC1101" /LENGTH=219 /DNA_ID=CAMNT_0042627627 /DNA_START=115 /DNA_END=771 /DNA_ORIENTATION=+
MPLAVVVDPISCHLRRPASRRRTRQPRRGASALNAAAAAVVVFAIVVLCRSGPAAVQSFGIGPRRRVPNRGSSSLLRSFSSPAGAGDGSESPRHVVIVGGGVGGMAVAARIASEEPNARVTLLEKNAEIGGRCGSFWVDPERQEQEQQQQQQLDEAGKIQNTEDNESGMFRHEQGPSLLLLKSVYEDVFADTTRKTARDYGLEMVQCSPAYQVVFDDGD